MKSDNGKSKKSRLELPVEQGIRLATMKHNQLLELLSPISPQSQSGKQLRAYKGTRTALRHMREEVKELRKAEREWKQLADRC